MPRNSTDDGEEQLANATKTSRRASAMGSSSYYEKSSYDDDDDEDLELLELERRLNDEVDEDFFAEPKRFNTIHRVIDVLGLQMIDDATVQSSHKDLSKNPAYRNLKAQYQIVEGAIEHMAVIHCADLNGSVIQVGKVARQFNDAVSRVRQLRQQVRDIQDTLGASANPNETGNSKQRPQNAASMSLRELWLKKLECESVLALLDRLDIIRAAPARFDQYISQQPCRIGAAVLQISSALKTMFSDDVAQVQALHKIMEQLLLRKQKGEEIVWETLQDIIYLRNGNEVRQAASIPRLAASKRDSASLASGDRNRSLQTSTSACVENKRLSAVYNSYGMYNPFALFEGLEDTLFLSVEERDDAMSVTSLGSDASIFSLEENFDEEEELALLNGSPVRSSQFVNSVEDSTTNSGAVLRKEALSEKKLMMIPVPVLDTELDLEADERRCMEDLLLNELTRKANMKPSVSRQRQLPRFGDSVMALRIIVECLSELKRLDDVERVLSDSLQTEIRTLVQKEQARTFARMEKRRSAQSIRSSMTRESMQDFRRHMTNLLSAFGCVMLRMSHLAQILRYRISSDKELLKSIPSPSTVMRTVLNQAWDSMQREIRDFLKVCLHPSERENGLAGAVDNANTPFESGLFSMNIVATGSKLGIEGVSSATRSNVMEMSTSKFVSTVLFAKTKAHPHPRHALVFRKSISRWTSALSDAKLALAKLTGEDTSAPSFVTMTEIPVLTYLDQVIEKELLPDMQVEAVNGTVLGLERRDAFDPVLDRGLYARPHSNDPRDVEMCVACKSMFNATGPLFLALHRLPQDGEMYMPLVAVLEHTVLTFMSRVKAQVAKLCSGKTALIMLSEEEGEATSFSAVMERRRPFNRLVDAYSDGFLSTSSLGAEKRGQSSGLIPLAPSPSDTVGRKNAANSAVEGARSLDEFVDGTEGEDAALQFELSYLKPYLDFSQENKKISISTDEELMRAACLAHSLLKLAGLLEARLTIYGKDGKTKLLSSTRALREAIKTIRTSGIKMAKFCRLDMLFQTISRMSRVCKSSTLVAQDAVRIPSSVNDLGDYITSASDNLREAAGNAVTAYIFSTLEQFIPYFLMQNVRLIAQGHGVIQKAPLTLNGVESLDRSGSVLYRDLKGATSFDNSFWDVELAAASFEKSAGFIAMLEFDMEELVAYYMANSEDYSDADFELMFTTTGPRRRGDVGRFHMAKRQLQ
ncbi:hypothetical protein FisN_4Lh133 [Fistulifera solaris]|uniref:Exocyst complex component Sec8 n=1 Tax=Fistulifera solaris TaxID=1519565 RepID=A0A1Z5JZU7_FISSO|nr:hypothetical protein FisN_4Lh133 [Fistulifera solaris]|eukprot:GAX19291.1 hypothetical protein FisN_4Lh133 [Fistulifera solaris]